MSTNILQINEKTYGQLLRRTLPHVIHSAEECERFTAELMEIDERENPTSEEKELADLLAMLIEQFEERRYSIRKATPIQVLHHLREARGLTQKDLWGVFDSKGITSEVVRGKLSISKTHAKKLASFFKVSADLFI